MNRHPPRFDLPTPGLFLGAHLPEVVGLNDPDQLSRVQVRLLNFDGVDGHDAPI